MKQILQVLYLYLSLAAPNVLADEFGDLFPIRPQEAPHAEDSYRGLVFRSEPHVNLVQLSAPKLIYSETKSRPWNGSYWPTYKGMLGHRYHDPRFPGSKNWSVNRAYAQSRPAPMLIAEGQVDRLSPSEKYDLLIGDAEWSLTKQMWQKGEKPAATWGNVPGWFGICHGWSAAAHMNVPEPDKKVTAINADGVSITFFPNDIKALASYLWATSAPKSLFIGSKCRIVNPERDEWGRVKEQTCLDSNPMTWHLSVVNRVGRDGDGLIMDSSMANQIWNYAIDSYSFRYFNLNTMKPSRGYEDSIVAIEDYGADPYKSYRTSGTRYVVGVMMDVFYPTAIEPKAFGKSKKRNYASETFIYDLELDAALNVIGGEWHSKERPDFLWTYTFDAQAGYNQNTSDVSVWSYGLPMPLDLAQRAQEQSRRGKVLARIVNGLVERSVMSEEEQPQMTEEERPVEEPGGNEDPGDQPGPETPGAEPTPI